jgi:hypothetical protein
MATAGTHAPIVGPGWVDQSVSRIRGLFPLSVERYLNEAIGTFAPSVTTVTNVARSYALHGLLMAEATSKRLDLEETRQLLRRAEVVMSLASVAHRDAPGHPRWFPAPHGADQLMRAWERGPVVLDEVAGTGTVAYAKNAWGFLGPYVGSEQRLGILGDSWSTPGPGFTEELVRPALADALKLATEWSTVTRSQAEQVSHLCICQAREACDGQWLACRLVGDPSRPHQMAGTIAATMTLIAKALASTPVGTESQLANVIRFSPLLDEDPLLAASPVAHRWRGMVLRHTAVAAWRTLWDGISRRAHEGGGFIAISDLQDWLAGFAPSGTVGEFLNGLPATMRGSQPLAAELQLDDDPLDPLVSVARVLLSGRRSAELQGDVEWGYLGEPDNRDRRQELSPRWVAQTTDRWHDRPMTDFCSDLVRLLIDRSQRVALDKAGYRGGRYVLPARVLLRDGGFVEWRDQEGAAPPPLRLERIVHIGRQVGLFASDDHGNWVLGPRGDLIAG